MAESTPGSRHLGVEGVRAYIDAGLAGRVQVEGSPTVYLVVDPRGERLALQVVAEGPLPDCSRYENVSAGRMRHDSRDWYQLAVATEDRVEDVYPLLCQVMDRLQLEGRSFAEAVSDVLAVYRFVLARRPALSDTDQVGLFGELLVLSHLITSSGAQAAVRGWLGPSAEEHDFGLGDVDLEVKTTTGERRRHWISTANQLTATIGRPLYLVSLQITRTGGAGHSLPSLVDEVLESAGPWCPAMTDVLDRAGYRDDDRDLYRQRWTLRTAPCVFAVTPDFPALTREALAGSPGWDRIDDLRYRIDLTGLPVGGLAILDGFVAMQGEHG